MSIDLLQNGLEEEEKTSSQVPKIANPVQQATVEQEDDIGLEQEMELMKGVFAERFKKSLEEVVSQEGFLSQRYEGHFYEAGRLKGHLSEFEENPSVGPSFEISVGLWAEGQEDNSLVVSVDRSVFFDKKTKEWKVYRTQILVHDEHQGKGIGSRLLANEEKLYKELGIQEILLKAGEPVGVYNNAREGFDFAHSEVKNLANQNFLKYVLEVQKEKGVKIVRIGQNDKNILPLRREFSAHELSQMRAFDELGHEVFFETGRLKEDKITKDIADAFRDNCYGSLASAPSDVLNNRFLTLWQPETMLSLKRASNLEEACSVLFKEYVERAKWYPDEQEEILTILRDEAFQSSFLKSLQQLDISDLLRVERYSLGKSYFLDMGREDHIPVWYGRKRLDK
jgi:GNAT superfamily N-acetyltransferase